MEPYLIANMQSYSKAASFLETEVLPNVKDHQTKQGIEFCIEHAKREAQNIQKAEKNSEKKD